MIKQSFIYYKNNYSKNQKVSYLYVKISIKTTNGFHIENSFVGIYIHRTFHSVNISKKMVVSNPI